MKVGHRAALPLETETPPPDPPGDGDPDAPFDPGAHTVAEVVAYVAANPDEREAVYGAELAGKGRITLLAALEEPAP